MTLNEVIANDRRLRIAVLEAGRNRPALEERFGTFGDSFNRYLDPEGTTFSFHDYAAYDCRLPESPDAYDGFIVTGSAANAFDDDEWITNLGSFVRRAAESSPVVGICFGHQLIARAFGGSVERAKDGWGIGVHTYDVVETREWMDPSLRQFRLVVSHQDQVVALPEGATILASSEFCPIAAMQIGENVMTMQAHPEAPPDYASAVYEFRRDVIGDDHVDAANESLNGEVDAKTVERWISRFLCRGHRP